MFRKTISIFALSMLLAPMPMNSAMAMQKPPQVSVAPRVASFGPKKPASSIDIMRRVIIKTINRDMNEHFAVETDSETTGTVITSGTAPVAPKAESSFGYVTTLYGGLSINSYAGDSRGHYIPGHGAVFSLEVAVPLIEKKQEESEDIVEPEEDDDLWTEATTEAEGRTSAFSRAVVTGSFLFNQGKAIEWRINPEGVDLAIDAVCAAVAKHGRKIESLQDDESIIVVLDIKPGQAFISAVHDAAINRLFYSYTVGSGGSADSQQIVIEVTVENLNRYASDRIDLDGLKSRATITRR